MAYRCERCEKGRLNIMAVSHAKNRSHRSALPNLHWVRVSIGGVTKRMRLCVKCAREIKKEMKKKEEIIAARLKAKQDAIGAKDKAKRTVKMEKKEKEQKARKTRSATKKNLKTENLKPKTKTSASS